MTLWRQLVFLVVHAAKLTLSFFSGSISTSMVPRRSFNGLITWCGIRWVDPLVLPFTLGCNSLPSTLSATFWTIGR